MFSDQDIMLNSLSEIHIVTDGNKTEYRTHRYRRKITVLWVTRN